MRRADAGSGCSRRWKAIAGVVWMVAMLVPGAAVAEPLSLDECIDAALQNNPGLASAKYDLTGARGSHLAASSAFLPSISMSGGFSHRETGAGVRTIEGVPFQTPYQKSENYSVGMNVQQSLIAPANIKRYHAAGADVDATLESVRISEVDLVFQVRQQYYLLFQAIRLADVAQEALDVSEEQLRKSEALYELGSVARTDVLQARVNRASSVQEVIRVKNSVDQEKAKLAVQLGMGVDEPLEIVTDLGDPPRVESLDEKALFGEAVKGLPEVRRARAQQQGAELSKDAAFWDQLPTLGASLFYGKDADELSEATNIGKDNAYWGFSVGLSWNIFDGFGRIGNHKAAKARVAAAREQSRLAELNSGLGVREALIAIRNAEEGIRAAEESVELAAENLKLQQALYENGGGTILELNNALADNTRARNSLIEAQVGLHLAYAQLDRAIGR